MSGTLVGAVAEVATAVAAVAQQRLEARAPRPQVLRPAQVRLLVALVLHRPQAEPHRRMERRQLPAVARAAGLAVVVAALVAAAADAAMRHAIRTLTALSTLRSSKWLVMPTACLR